MTKNRTDCKTCNGSGQISFFKGVSRFLLSQEECPECAGLGYLVAEDIDQEEKDPSLTPTIRDEKDVD